MSVDKNLIVPLVESAMTNGFSISDGWEVYMAYSGGKIDIIALQKSGTLARLLTVGAKMSADKTTGPQLAAFLYGLLS